MRKVLTALAVLVLAGSVLLTLSRFASVPVAPVAMAASFSTYAVVGYVVAGLLLLALVRGSDRRGPVLAGVILAVVAVGYHGYVLAPLYYGNARGHQGDLTVLTVNLDLGAGDADTVVRRATGAKADVVVLEEVTPAALQRLDASGLGDLLPNRVGTPSAGASGTMVFSAAPLTGQRDLGLGNGGLSVRVGGPHPVRLLAVHTTAPAFGVRRWRSDLAAVRSAALAAQGPVLAVGDFNATTDHAPFRRLLGAGLSDATAQANTGWQPTWPTRYRRSFERPLIAIDHVLTTSQYSAMSVQTLDVRGTDHRGLLVRLDRL